LAKDQMVTVAVPLGTRRPECVMPYEAVIYDVYAGTWSYLDITPAGATTHIYERRRVELGPRVELSAEVYQGRKSGIVIGPGGAPTERVVTVGAAGLFSRESYKPPVQVAPSK